MASDGQKKFLSTLDALSKEDIFCDIQIEFSNGNRKFNRLVLAALSPFFEAMLSTCMKEGLTGVIYLQTVSIEIFESVVDFYIRGIGELNEDVLIEALDTAEMMQLPDLKEICVKKLKGNVSSENCLKVWIATRKYTTDQTLESKAYRLVCENFRSVCHQDEFLQLSKDDVIRFVRQKHIESESCFLEAVIFWIENNQINEDDAMQLLTEIRLSSVEPNCLVRNVCKDGILKYTQARKFLNNHIQNIFKPEEMTTRYMSDMCDVVFVCSSSKNCFNVHAWDVVGCRWHDLSLKPQHESLTSASSTFLDQDLLITGGLRSGPVSDTHIFNTMINSWRVGPKLIQARYNHGSVSLPNSVYVIGGCSAEFKNGQLVNMKYLNSLEQWSPNTRRWATVGNLAREVENPGVASIGKFILVIGGSNDRKLRDNESFIQCFNTLSNSSCFIENKIDYGTNTVHIYGKRAYIIDMSFVFPKIYAVKLEECEETVKVTPEEMECGIMPGFFLRYAETKPVLLGDKVVFFNTSLTKAVSLSNKSSSPLTMPTLPGDIHSIFGAVRARIPRRCLSSLH